MDTEPLRVLVTGSRDWPFPLIVDAALDSAAHLTEGPKNMVIVHGACTSGADKVADQWGSRNGAAIAAYPAKWQEYGRAAGPMRNAKMVNLGADLCLAFISPCSQPSCTKKGKHGSHGATSCADLAEANGIRTFRYEIH